MASGVPIVQCGQCSTCKTYVPIPSNLLASLNAAPKLAQNVQLGMSNQGPTYQPIPSNIISTNQVTAGPPVGSTVHPYANSLTNYENSWRSKFLKLPVLIHGIVELVLACLIIILEIAALGTSTYSATGAGIWCGISFMTTAILTILLVRKWNQSRFWATRVLIAQLIMLVFTFILIGIVGAFVSSNGSILSLYLSESSYGTSNYGNNFSAKYHIMQAQLAFAVLLMFAGFAYVVFYCVVTYLAIWKPFQNLDTSHLFRE